MSSCQSMQMSSFQWLLLLPGPRHGYKKRKQKSAPSFQNTGNEQERPLPECNTRACISNRSLENHFAWINIGFALAPVMAPCAGGRALSDVVFHAVWQAGVGGVGTSWGLSSAHLNSLVPNHATALGDYTLPHSTHTLLPLPVWAPVRSFAWNKMEMEPLFMPTEMECVIKGTIVQKRWWR